MSNVVCGSISQDDIVARFQRGGSTLPKNIIVNKKGEVINAAKTRRNPGLSETDMRFNQEVEIFVNEHLSPFYKLLHKKACEFCKATKYKYCWVKDMKIYVKKTDDSRAVLVGDEIILSKLGH